MWPFSWFTYLRQQLDKILGLLQDIKSQGDKIMATLDEVLAKVTEESTADDSIIVLLIGIKQQLADALTGVTLPPAVQAKVDAVFQAASDNVTKINTAINA
jgi:altronate dehydratase